MKPQQIRVATTAGKESANYNRTMLSSRLILAARLRSAACGGGLFAAFGPPAPAPAPDPSKSLPPGGRTLDGHKPPPPAGEGKKETAHTTKTRRGGTPPPR